eukprot:3504210-Rhodomonas_salina.2
MSGTDLASATTRGVTVYPPGTDERELRGICPRAPYAMPGIDVAYGARGSRDGARARLGSRGPGHVRYLLTHVPCHAGTDEATGRLRACYAMSGMGTASSASCLRVYRAMPRTDTARGASRLRAWYATRGTEIAFGGRPGRN